LAKLPPEKIEDIVHPQDKKLVWDRFRDRLAGKQVPSHYEFRAVRKDGSVRWVEMYADRVKYNGKYAVQGAVMDITERKTAEEELRVEKAYLEELFQSAPESIVLVDNNSNVLRANGEFTRTFGYTSEEILGKCIDDLIVPSHLCEEAASITKRIKGGERVSFETVRQRKDGTTVNVSILGNPIKVEGEQVAVYGIYRDITDRTRAEEALRESDEKYRGIFNNAQVGMFRSRVSDGKILECNERHAQMYGYRNREECIAEFTSSEHYIDPGMRKRMLSQIKKTGEINNFEARFSRKDGSVIWVRFSARLYREKGFLEGVVTDVSEEKRAVAEVGKSEEKYRVLVENATDAVVIIQDNQIKFHNPRTEALIGCSSLELVNFNFIHFVHPADQKLVLKKYESWFRGDEYPSSLTCRLVHKNGDMLWGEINAVRIVWEGKPAVLSFIRDITNEKKLGAQLQQAQKMEAIGTLAGGIAHDFNNLLQAVLGYSDLLLLNKGRDDTDYRELQEIRRAAQRGTELTQQLLTFSRKVESKLRPLNLNNEVQQVHELLKRTIPKMIEIKLRLSKNLKPVNADPSQIGQALMNLAVNAKDAMPGGGKILIETENVGLDDKFCKTHIGATPGDYVLLSVSDTGHGMERDSIARIFEPFYTTKKVGVGTGLGLAMVYGIVKNHSGYITCESRPGKGTAFKIYFPVIDQESELEEEKEGTAPSGGTETILLVDDEKFIRDLGVRVLTTYGYRVLTASDGEAALRLYGKEYERIDLIILDLIMPKMSGGQCFEGILKINPDAKVIIASGYAADQPIKGPIEDRSRCFIGKPFKVRHLLKSVRDVLNGP
jgi:PAS domain S-box-containing protein